MYLAIEGVIGVGKTTLAALLAPWPLELAALAKLCEAIREIIRASLTSAV